MSLMHHPSSLGDLVTLRDAMERLFDDRFPRTFWPFSAARPTGPALDLYDTADAVVAKVALPGVKPEDVDISVAEGLVTVTGSFSEEISDADAGFVHKELSRGTFSRSFVLPTAVKAEAATATFKDGLLTLTLPKTEAAKPTHVKVQVTT
jgi:HSP20 family protein